MKLRMLGLVAGFCSLSTVALADGVAGTTVVYETRGNWSGLYVGLNIGGGWADTDWRLANANFFGVAGQGFDANPEGMMYGVQAGYNHQWGQWVLGAEVSYDRTHLRDVVTGQIKPFPFDTHTTTLEDLLTVTGRLGYAMDGLLLYGKAGYASGRVQIDSLAGPPGAGVFGEQDKRLGGWTAGGGVEFKLNAITSIGIEYNYTKLGGENFTFPLLAAGGGPQGGAPESVNLGDVTIQSVMARINFKLDWDRKSEPLK